MRAMWHRERRETESDVGWGREIERERASKIDNKPRGMYCLERERV